MQLSIYTPRSHPCRDLAMVKESKHRPPPGYSTLVGQVPFFGRFRGKRNSSIKCQCRQLFVPNHRQHRRTLLGDIEIRNRETSQFFLLSAARLYSTSPTFKFGCPPKSTAPPPRDPNPLSFWGFLPSLISLTNQWTLELETGSSEVPGIFVISCGTGPGAAPRAKSPPIQCRQRKSEGVFPLSTNRRL